MSFDCQLFVTRRIHVITTCGTDSVLITGTQHFYLQFFFFFFESLTVGLQGVRNLSSITEAIELYSTVTLKRVEDN